MYFTIHTDTTGNTEITLNYLEKKNWAQRKPVNYKLKHLQNMALNNLKNMYLCENFIITNGLIGLLNCFYFPSIKLLLVYMEWSSLTKIYITIQGGSVALDDLHFVRVVNLILFCTILTHCVMEKFAYTRAVNEFSVKNRLVIYLLESKSLQLRTKKCD